MSVTKGGSGGYRPHIDDIENSEFASQHTKTLIKCSSGKLECNQCQKSKTNRNEEIIV